MKTIVYSYDSNAWHLGALACSAFVIVLICGVLTLVGPLHRISK
jgi:hypothetical protein